MKKIEAIIRESKVETVRTALQAQGIEGLTVVRAEVYGLQGSRTMTYRGVEKSFPQVPRAKLEIIVPEDQWIDAVGVIDDHAQTGEVGDGRIMVIDLEYASRVGRREAYDFVRPAQPQAVAESRISPTPTPGSPHIAAYSASRI